jgi:hypothetical protein
MQNDPQSEKRLDSRLRQKGRFILRRQSKEEFAGTSDGRVVNPQDTSAQSLLHTGRHRRHSVFIPKLLDLDRQTGHVVRKLHECMPIADQVRDPIHTNIDFISIQAVDTPVKVRHLGIEAFSWRVMKRVGVSLGQFARQEMEIGTPLLFCHEYKRIRRRRCFRNALGTRLRIHRAGDHD